MKCNRHMTTKDQFGNKNEKECNRRPAFKVSYECPVRLKIIAETICKMHFNATLNMLAKLNREFLYVQDISNPK